MQVIRHREIVRSDTTLLPKGSSVEAMEEALREGSGAVLVHGEDYLARREALQGKDRVGVWLSPDSDPETLSGDLAGFPMVAVEFPTFRDGRGYSIARIVREQLGYRGELRAFGNVLRDQLRYMERCGFDSFELAPGRSAQDALEAFTEFSNVYQGAADRAETVLEKRRR
ncbi:MAG: DUF934 domain-containing protein [Myxococcales bacterium]|nr:DUF934 domain-containing protein [Myxococcales bacterium]